MGKIKDIPDISVRFLNVVNNLTDEKGNKITAYKLDKVYNVASQSQITNIKYGKNKPSDDTIDKLIGAFPNVNKAYIYVGSLPMFNDGSDPVLAEETLSYHEVPLLPVSAIGGTLSGFYTQILDTGHEKIISPIKGVDFAITVTGDSMAPEYPSGSKILIKKIFEKVFIEWGKTYVLDTVNGAVVKNLFPAKDEDGNIIANKVICKSINPEFPDFSIELNENNVFGVYRVLMCLSMK